jgi:UPF0755 protein
MIIFILTLSSISYLQVLTGPVGEEDISYKEIRIKPGFSSSQIANILTQQGLIRNPFLFKAMVRFRGAENKLQTGYYNLSTGMSIDEIIDKLINGKIVTYQFSIPEGFTVEKIAQRIAEKATFSSEDFLVAVHKFNSEDLSILNGLNLQKRSYSLEGYLFPETYKIPQGTKPEDIIKNMLEEFEDELSVELLSKIYKSEYNLDQIITIASLIEAEAKYDSERKLISSVIYNRLEKGMGLQIDATIQYILSDHKEKILYSDLTIDSPYNTYQNSGLPPGPINNPGLDSIKAALNPADTDYLYYFAFDDGIHKFSKTYQEHLRLQNKFNY